MTPIKLISGFYLYTSFSILFLMLTEKYVKTKSWASFLWISLALITLVATGIGLSLSLDVLRNKW